MTKTISGPDLADAVRRVHDGDALQLSSRHELSRWAAARRID